MADITPQQPSFMATDLPRFEANGAWECATNPKWVSRLFLVLKLGENKWRLINDLR
jgi:hypothetical protein